MEPDSQARTLGYKSAEDWLTQAEQAGAAGLATPRLLTEYDQIFWSGRAITRSEARLIEAIEGPTAREWAVAKWPHERVAPYLDEGRLSAENTRRYFDALDALDRL